MQVEEQTKLIFHGVEILRVEFRSLGVGYSPDDHGNIEVDLNPGVFYPKDNAKAFRIVMELTLEAKTAFFLKVVAVGDFTISREIPEDEKRSLVNANAPAIMFPYVRSFIATFTANSGHLVGTLNIPPHFFQGELKEYEYPNEAESDDSE